MGLQRKLLDIFIRYYIARFFHNSFVVVKLNKNKNDTNLCLSFFMLALSRYVPFMTQDQYYINTILVAVPRFITSVYTKPQSSWRNMLREWSCDRRRLDEATNQILKCLARWFKKKICLNISLYIGLCKSGDITMLGHHGHGYQRIRMIVNSW